ncbi:MAG: hypothetical protein K5928_00395 [Prevotella sp.]|nr:hypothetical protein [Prevotella sp.]
MKKSILGLLAAAALVSSCGGGEREYLSFHGIPMNTPFEAFVDSLQQRGYQIDTTRTDSAYAKLFIIDAEQNITVDVATDTAGIAYIIEEYHATYNDSTRQLYPVFYRQFQNELGGKPWLRAGGGDDHKEAVFETEKGILEVNLKNTSFPMLQIVYKRDTNK